MKILILILLLLFYLNNKIKFKKNPLEQIFIKLYPYSTLNPKNYNDALKSSKELLQLQKMAIEGHQIPNQIIDIAEQLQRDILNDIQSLIHSFPSTVIDNHNFEIYRNILQKILQNIIDDIKDIYLERYERVGPTIYNPPPCNRSGPWKNPLVEKDYNSNWNYYY